ncbi:MULTISPECIES: hypothetical protein [Caballeronia]|nr:MULTISPECIES: hypothetical protein [Caballeronia]
MNGKPQTFGGSAYFVTAAYLPLADAANALADAANVKGMASYEPA